MLAPNVRLYDNELDHPKYQAFIDQDRLYSLSDTNEALLERIDDVLESRHAAHSAILSRLCRGRVTWRVERLGPP